MRSPNRWRSTQSSVALGHPFAILRHMCRLTATGAPAFTPHHRENVRMRQTPTDARSANGGPLPERPAAAPALHANGLSSGKASNFCEDALKGEPSRSRRNELGLLAQEAGAYALSRHDTNESCRCGGCHVLRTLRPGKVVACGRRPPGAAWRPMASGHSAPYATLGAVMARQPPPQCTLCALVRPLGARFAALSGALAALRGDHNVG